MVQDGFAVVAFRDSGRWDFEPLPHAVLSDLTALLGALRAQQPDGGPFVLANVDDEFFLIARLRGAHVDLLLSDLTAAVEYDLAQQVLERLGEEPPDDDELDEVWPLGDLDLFADLGLPEEELAEIVDDLDAYADEMLAAIMDRLGLAADYERVVSALTAR